MPISLDQPLVHNFRRKVDPLDQKRLFPTKIVVSYLDRQLLPDRLESGMSPALSHQDIILTGSQASSSFAKSSPTSPASPKAASRRRIRNSGNPAGHTTKSRIRSK